MQTNSFTTADGINIHTKYWKPENDSERVIIIIHGIGEHSGRYLQVAEELRDADYHVYSLDHRGHGQSGGKRLRISSTTDFIDDLKQYYDRIKSSHPDSKIYILGHSMGSVISLQFILSNPGLIEATVITGTATDVASGVPPALRMIANFIYLFFPNAPISPPGSMDVLSRDPEIVKQAENDPLMNHGWTPVAIAKFVIETGEMIQERANKITMPIIFMHGEADELTPISGSKIMYERVSSEDKALKTWADMRHEIMNEIGREEVISEIVDWFNKH